MRSRKGPKIAVKAMARKLAVLYWRVMVKGLDYAEKGIEQYEQQIVANKFKALSRLARELKLDVIGNAQLTG
jgi:transposase